MGQLAEKEYWCILGCPRKPKIHAHELCPGFCKYRREADGSKKPSKRFNSPCPPYRIKINGENLFALFVLEEKFGLNLDRHPSGHKNNLCRIWDAEEKCWFIRKHFEREYGDPGIEERFLLRMRSYKQKTFVRVLDPHPQTEYEAYVPKQAIFGPKTLIRLEAEIRERINKGQKLNRKILSELKRKFNYKDHIDPRIIGYIWNSVRKEIQPFQGRTPQELEAERNWESLSDSLPRDAMRTKPKTKFL